MKDHIIDYTQKIYPFHMPGHKLGRIGPLSDVNLYGLDVTEVDGMDYLYEASGMIKEAQNRARDFYGAMESFFLVNGSTGGILSAISTCCRQDGKILISRNSHKSVYNSILINRLDPIYLYPEYIEAYGLVGGIDPRTVETALNEHPDISCVVITSPSYEGFTSDIDSISDIVHKYKKLLIVDEAHGAHFKLSNQFPKSALECGADIVIHSLHKTLPAFTQSAVLHVNNSNVNLEKLREYLSIYQTSSPSYILMTGIDSCIKLLEQDGEALVETYLNNLEVFKEKMKGLNHIKLIGKEFEGHYGIKEVDVSKLIFAGKNVDMNGKSMEKELREVFHLQVEMSMPVSVLAITSIADDLNAFEKLYKALANIDIKEENLSTRRASNINSCCKVDTPFLTSQKQQECILVKDAANRISGQFVTVYPPGIPILIPGERVTEGIIGDIKDYVQNGIKVLGIENGLIKVVV
ncbi:MAG: hypothetical protein CVU84_16595 [Firmicutes bacterium HGW-Firmicutes-1]|jgi:arginine/lysine/ornithine decarboxylase|nr:MAG: hypothetical protein CVU84_16595 [Firmicutes bacterium HGW-Firmicutes-1]